ncbi:TPA: hypothetical protein QIW60_003579 [Escherichia coli]|uniref:hypothetical protein n=1 Tax=Enterobacteriaceae TaxID=543 RepID=UPI001284C299|nr:hypothetical protein [Cronobacter muytjensii]EAM5005967.1 hypothetical protein [Salmonella enterica]EES5376845.1 hypothetical protein [Escherichia coli]EAT8674972.1 hypothetical protein [Salmonella enterica]EEC2753778.1 hypothetical protein [Salmonella enterica]EES5680341.1 hypothetical protein [Escherichia coli]
MKPDYRGKLATGARLKKGFTQQQMADYLGLSLNAWQKKEQEETRVSGAEYHLFMLILNEHPEYELAERKGR